MQPIQRQATDAEVKEILDRVAGTLPTVKEHHDLPGGPIATDTERLLSEERVDKGRAESVVLSHRLEDLEKEFFLFTFAPVLAVTGFPYDVVYQFGSAMQLDRVPRVLNYQSPSQLFHGEGDWVFRLQGLPLELGGLFDKFVLNMVITDSAVPRPYWRVNSELVKLYTPLQVSAGVKVRVYTPTGVDFRIGVVEAGLKDRLVQFFRGKPERWVQEEAQRYFMAT